MHRPPNRARLGLLRAIARPRTPQLRGLIEDAPHLFRLRAACDRGGLPQAAIALLANCARVGELAELRVHPGREVGRQRLSSLEEGASACEPRCRIRPLMFHGNLPAPRRHPAPRCGGRKR